VLHIAPQALREVMQRSTGRADGSGTVILGGEPSHGGDLKCSRTGEKAVSGRKGPVIVPARNLERRRAKNRAL